MKAAILMAALLIFTGCHTHPFEITVENRSGTPIRLLEVDYPSASFGADNLAAGEIYRDKVQLRGSGAVKVAYTAADGRLMQSTGVELAEREEGRLEIVLLGEGKVEFHPQFAK